MSSEDFSAVRLATAGGIKYRLINGYPKFSETMGSITAEEEYIIEMTDVPAFLREVLPRDNTIERITLPRKMPGADHLTTVKVDVSPCDESRPIDPYIADLTNPRASTYGVLAKVHIYYEAISRAFVREVTVGIGAEYLHIPPSNLFVSQTPESTAVGILGALPFANGTFNLIAQTVSSVQTNTNTDNLLGAYKIVPTAEWTYKLQPFATTPIDWLGLYYQHLGKVNSVQAMALCENALVETVLFSGVSATKIFTNYLAPNNDDGTSPSSWLVELKFSQRAAMDDGKFYTWNHVYSPKQGKWTKLERAPKGSGNWLYDSADLAAFLLNYTTVLE